MKQLSKKVISLSLCLPMVFSLLTGCGEQAASSSQAEAEDALTITIGNSSYAHAFLEAIQEKFPDIPLDIDYYSGPNSTEYIRQKMSHGETSDLFCSFNILDHEMQKENLLIG